MPALDPTEEIRKYLVDEGVVTNGEDGDDAPPPCWYDPRDGAMNMPIPGGAESVVILLTGQGIVNPFLEARFLQDIPLEVIVRSKNRPTCVFLHRTIFGLMAEKENLLMGDLLIERSSHFREVQEIAKDADSWTLSQSFRVSYRRESLTV